MTELILISGTKYLSSISLNANESQYKVTKEYHLTLKNQK